jgi:chitinase
MIRHESGGLQGNYMRRLLLFASLSLSVLLGSFGFAQTCVRTDILVQGGNITPGSINRYGTVVGTFAHADGSAGLGFRWNNGVFNTYQFSGSTRTDFAASNDKGQIVGSYFKNDGSNVIQHGLLFENGTFTTIDYPGAVQTEPTGINNAGDIVGYFETVAGGENHAFLKHGTAWTELVPPQGFDPDAYAISNSGVVLGHYSTNDGLFTFLYQNGRYRTFGPKPGSTLTAGFAINKYGTIVGYLTQGSNYAFTYKNGIYYSYIYPVPKGTSWLTVYTGVNDLGDRVGYAGLSNGATQAFVMKCR